MDQIIGFRDRIDEIDEQIMSLLDERYGLSSKIGDIKSKSKYNVLDTKREKTILDKTLNYSHSPQIKEVYKSIFTQSKELQRK